MDWSNPVQRYHLIEAIGPEEYNRRMTAAHTTEQALFGKTVEIYQSVRRKGKVDWVVQSQFGLLVRLEGDTTYYRASDCRVVS